MDWSVLLPSFFALVQDVFQLLLVVGIGFLINFIRLKISEEKLTLIEKIITEGVKFAQQVYKDAGGEEKYEKAVEQITTVLNSKGLKINEVELKMLIESVLKQMKKEFGDQWYE